MSSRQRGLRFLSLGVVFALALALLAACGEEKPPQTIVNTTIGQSTERGGETAETTEATTEAEVEVPEEAETPEEADTEQETTEEETETAEAPDDDEAAQELFISATCGGCHTLSAAGAAGQVGPSLDGANLEVGAVEQQIRKGSGSMPPFEGQLSDAEIKSLAKYVSESSQG